MNIVYFSHSYNDPLVNEYFSQLIQSENLILSLDPPSDSFNAAKLIRYLNNCNGMIALPSRRSDATIVPFEANVREDDLLAYIAAIDSKSKFLIARGITLIPPHALSKVKDFHLITGRGGSGKVDKETVAVVTEDYLKQNDIVLDNNLKQLLLAPYDVR